MACLEAGCTKTAGSLTPSGSPSADTQPPTSGSAGRAGSVPSQATSGRRSPLVSNVLDSLGGVFLIVMLLESEALSVIDSKWV